jgi:hypothetical protein
MTLKNKLILGALLTGGSFLSGFYTGKGNKEVTTIVKKGETRTVYKDRIVTVTKIVRPDGTVEETTKTEEKEGKSDSTTVDKGSTTKSSLSDYSVGAMYFTRFDSLDPGLNNLMVTGGRRLIGEIWLDVGIIPSIDKPGAAIGISAKF